MLNPTLTKTKDNNKYVLDKTKNVKGAWSLRKLSKYATKAIRVRDDSSNEIDIGFVGENLDTQTLSSWLTRNYIVNPLMITDTNADSMADSWSAFNGNGTYAYTVDGGQKIQMVTSNANAYAGVQQVITPMVAYMVVTVSLNCKLNIVGAGLYVRIRVTCYNSSDASLGNNDVTHTTDTGADFVNKTMTFTAPATTAYMIATVRVATGDANGTGSGWFKNYSVTVANQSAYVKTWYDQSGNQKNATQATITKQPRIVINGLIIRDFDGTKSNNIWSTFASASALTIVSNGDFSNSTTGWSASASTNSVSSNVLSNTGSGTTGFPTAFQNTTTPTVLGDRWFVRATLTPMGSPNYISCIVRCNTNSSDVGTAFTLNTPTATQAYTLSGVVTDFGGNGGNITLNFVHNYNSGGSANAQVMKVENVVCIKVTNYGLPTLYFDGTNYVLPIATASGDSLDVLRNTMMINAVFNPSIYQYGCVICKNATSTSDIQYGILWQNQIPYTDMILENSIRQDTASGTFPLYYHNIYSGTFSPAVQQGYINGVASGAAGSFNSTLTTRANMQIGANSTNAGGTTFGNLFGGYISEIIILGTTSYREYLEKSQGKYYGITVG